jgi:DNA polymerase III delta prime subunit
MCDSAVCEAEGRRGPEAVAGNMRDGERTCMDGMSVPKSNSFQQVKYNDDGLTALIFTAEGDMRQAINNLQSTHSGFGFVSADNVFKVCDQPHPVTVQAMIRACLKSDVDQAMEKLSELWNQGYSAVDIVVTIFRVVKTFDEWVS